MSKPRKKNTNNFNYTPTSDLAAISANVEWDLKGLFYASPTDTRLMADVVAAEKRYVAFAKKYQNGAFVKTDKALLTSLHDYKALHDTKLDRVFVYLFLCREKNAADTKAEQVVNQLEQRITKVTNQVIFYSLAIGQIAKDRQSRLLKNKAFAEYHFLLSGMFKAAAHQLSELEEKILSLKSMTSRGLWIAGTDKILNTATITVGKEEMSLNGAMMEMLDAPKARRHALWRAIVPKLQAIGPVAENELVALFLDKKINDELRGYPQPYSATVDSFDTTEATLSALTETITDRGYALSRKFYRLKKKLYGHSLAFIDRDDYPTRMPELSFATAVEIVRDAFYRFNPDYGSIFDTMLQNGHLDVWPHQGKGGGAFCISASNCPTMVMLNHANDFSSLRTLAHEMGHAIHAHHSKEQSVLYDDHSVLTAETASTFFEAVVAHTLMEQLSPAQKKIYLNALISDKIGTMMMCIARYQAELEMHETVRAQGSMTWQDMSAVLAKHFKAYCGKAVTITDENGLSVIAKTHYRRNFYQFSYSFGVIMSSIMFSRCLADESYKTSVDTFLRAGEKDSVEAIFKEIGINTKRTDAFHEGLDLLEDNIKEFDTLHR